MTPKGWIVAALVVLALVRVYFRIARRKKIASQNTAVVVPGGAAVSVQPLAAGARSESSGWQNALLIGRREFLERVRTKAFIFMTLLVPGVMVLMYGSMWLAATHMNNNQSLTIASDDYALAQDLRAELLSQKGASGSVINIISPVQPGTEQQLIADVNDKRTDSYLLLQSQGPGQPPKATYASRVSSDITGSARIEDALGSALLRERLGDRGVSSGEVDAMLKHVNIITGQVKNGHFTQASSIQSFYAAYIMMFLLYFSVTYYAMNTARSVVQEKTSRIYEVMLATVSPEQTMAGKMIGVGGAGLLQIAIWVGLGAVLATVGIAYAGIGNQIHMSVSWLQVIAFCVYFVLGFLLYSAMAAALGAIVSAEQEVQQFAFPLIFPMFIVVVSLVYILSSPGSVYAIALSLIPWTAPIAMLLRVSASIVPVWQLALSFVLLAGTIWLVLLLAARIYRIGILMYGKRPTLPEIIRWLRYA